MTKVGFYTLGCKVNQSESQKICDDFISLGYEIGDFNDLCDIYVINTCTVTAVADQKSRKMIRQARNKNENGIVCAIGCYSVTQKEQIASIEGIDLILGNDIKDQTAYLCDELFRKRGIQVQRAEHQTTDIKGLFRARANLKIQDGCRQFCTYCIIPYARGNWNSTPKEEVLRKAGELADSGVKEIVLLGIHLGCYGIEWGEKDALTDILIQLLKTYPSVRFRLGSLEPMEATTKLLETMAQYSNACDHLHLPLQCGDAEILKAMNRPYTLKQYEDKINECRKILPDLAFTTDLMVGFPGETDQHFQNSYDFAKWVGYSHIHVFPYSRRPGTPADQMKDQIEKAVKEERVAKLIRLSEEGKKAYCDRFIGKKLSVLFEEKTREGYYKGHSSNYIDVIYDSKGEDLRGIIKEVELTGPDMNHPEVVLCK